jgi:hypothetical protein
LKVALTDEELTEEKFYPPLFIEADQLSVREQDRFFRWNGFSLILTVLIAVLSVLAGVADAEFGRIDVIAAIAGLMFVALVCMTIFLDRERPDGRWYQARAVAESVKTLAWQYAAGGGELMVGGPGNPDAIFRARLGELADLSKGLRIKRAPEQIKPPMEKLRAASLDDRFEVYYKNRIESQRVWYLERSERKDYSARILFRFVIAAQLGGVTLAGIGAFGLVDVGVLGVPAALGAVIIAWQQAKDYTVLARSYEAAANDLEKVRDDADNKKPFVTEHAWAEFVDTAEQAISREHTLWLARRGVTPPTAIRTRRKPTPPGWPGGLIRRSSTPRGLRRSRALRESSGRTRRG